MRINGFTPLTPVQPRAGRKRTDGSSSAFSASEGESTQASSATVGGAMVGGLDALLALQAVEDPLAERKRTIQHGHDLLDTLDRLKADLLGGRVSPDRLLRLMDMIGRRKPGNDQDLEALLDDIELRARVELAKLGHFAP